MNEVALGTERCRLAVVVAAAAGANYADARFVDLASKHLAVRTGEVESIRQPSSSGIGVRVIAGNLTGH